MISWLGERVIADIRNKLFKKILSFDINQFETLKVGEILSRLTSDTAVIQHAVGNSFAMFIRECIQIVGAAVMMLLTSLQLTLIFFISVPLILLPSRVVMLKQRSLSKIGQDKMALSSSFAGETLFAIQITQAFTHEPYDRRLFYESVENTFKAQLKSIRMRSILTFVVAVGVSLGFLLVIWVGANLTNQDPQIITRGQLLQFLAYAVILSSAVLGLSEVVGEIQRVSGASERLVELLNLEPLIKTNKNAIY